VSLSSLRFHFRDVAKIQVSSSGPVVEALSFGLECMALLFIIFLRHSNFQYLTGFNCLYFISTLIFIYLLNTQWVLTTLRSTLKLAVAHLSGIHLAAIHTRASFYANYFRFEDKDAHISGNWSANVRWCRWGISMQHYGITRMNDTEGYRIHYILYNGHLQLP